MVVDGNGTPTPPYHGWVQRGAEYEYRVLEAGAKNGKVEDLRVKDVLMDIVLFQSVFSCVHLVQTLELDNNLFAGTHWDGPVNAWSFWDAVKTLTELRVLRVKRNSRLFLQREATKDGLDALMNLEELRLEGMVMPDEFSFWCFKGPTAKGRKLAKVVLANIRVRNRERLAEISAEQFNFKTDGRELVMVVYGSTNVQERLQEAGFRL